MLTTLNGGVDVLDARAPRAAARGRDNARARRARPARCRAAPRPAWRSRFDLAELGGYNYDSGLTFAAFAPGSPDAIARGGRYDEVGASFGRTRPAIGFSLDLRQLARLAAPSGRRRAILAPCADDAALQVAIDALRADGEIVVVDLPGRRCRARRAGGATARSRRRMANGA